MKVYALVVAAVLTAKVLEYAALSLLELRTRRKMAQAYEAKRSEIQEIADRAWKRNAARVSVGDELHDAGLD